MAIGAFANIAVIMQARAVTTHVTVIRAVLSMPVVDKIFGFTKMIYAIARKVVVPAINSVEKLVFRSVN